MAERGSAGQMSFVHSASTDLRAYCVLGTYKMNKLPYIILHLKRLKTDKFRVQIVTLNLGKKEID